MKRYSQQQIQDLLDKFMNGLTTLEEESVLGDYFRTHEVPQEWEDYRVMFDYFDRGMEGDLVSVEEPSPSLARLVGRRWWGIGAAAAIAAAVVGTVMLHHPSTTVPQQPTDIAQTDNDTLITPPVVEAAPQLASTSFERPSPPVRPVHPARPSTRRLQAENAKLARENERLQRELEDLKRRAFIIDMEANGFKAVMNEDGNIVFIDLEQEIENELNNQPTTNIPEI